MKIKSCLLILVIIFSNLIVCLSSSSAQDLEIPLLTWEKGKEQNLVLGAASGNNDWRIKLSGDNYKDLYFARSAVDADGSIIYSITLPGDMPIGLYSIQTISADDESTNIVAGVEVVEMQTYEITAIPNEFRFVLIGIVFLLAILISHRRKKIRTAKLIPNEKYLPSFEDSARKPISFNIYKLFRYRNSNYQTKNFTVFSFIFYRDSQFLLKHSVFLWTTLPLVGLGIGVVTGIISGVSMPNIPIIFLLVLAMLGVIDSLSGFYSAVGFVSAQLIFGPTPSMTSILAMISISFGWIFCGLFGSYFFNLFEDIYRNTLSKRELVYLVPSILAPGCFFIFFQYLANSFSINRREDTYLVFLSGLLISITNLVKLFIDRSKSTFNTKNEASDFVVVKLNGVISSASINFLWLIYMTMTYSWTQSISLALISGILFVSPLWISLVELTKPKITFLANIPRNAFLEAVIVSILSFGLFEIIDTQPLLVNQKSVLYMTVAFLPNLLHAMLTVLSDIDRESGVKTDK